MGKFNLIFSIKANTKKPNQKFQLTSGSAVRFQRSFLYQSSLRCQSSSNTCQRQLNLALAPSSFVKKSRKRTSCQTENASCFSSWHGHHSSYVKVLGRWKQGRLRLASSSCYQKFVFSRNQLFFLGTLETTGLSRLCSAYALLQ